MSSTREFLFSFDDFVQQQADTSEDMRRLVTQYIAERDKQINLKITAALSDFEMAIKKFGCYNVTGSQRHSKRLHEFLQEYLYKPYTRWCGALGVKPRALQEILDAVS